MSLTDNWKKILNRNNRILSVSHLDLDGVGCSIVLQNIYKNIEFKSLKYGDVDEFLKTVNFKNYDCVILTDISPEHIETFDLSDKIFLLDHHETALKFHCPEKNRLINTKNSASVFVKEFFEKLFNLDFYYLNDLISIIDDFDTWKLKDSRSRPFNELYFKMYESDFRRRFGNGNTKLTQEEIDYVLQRKKEFNKVYENLDIWELDSINACFVISTNFINDICHKLMDEKGYQLTICINPKSRSCSVRTKEDCLDVGKVLEILGIGGGHKKSSAFRLSENEEVSHKIDMIEKYLYYNYEDIRK